MIVAPWFQSLPAAQNMASKQDLNQITVKKYYLPALAGQQADYTVNALFEYKNGTLHNNIYSRMRVIAKQLSDTLHKALSFISGLKSTLYLPKQLQFQNRG